MNSDEKRGIERFRRVKEEEIEVDHRVGNNSFDAKVSVLKENTKGKREEEENGSLLDTK